jgi:hypothetical protein
MFNMDHCGQKRRLGRAARRDRSKRKGTGGEKGREEKGDGRKEQGKRGRKPIGAGGEEIGKTRRPRFPGPNGTSMDALFDGKTGSP